MGLNEAQKKERSQYLEEHLKITECSQRKPYVFISYASDNWKTVFQSVVVPMQERAGLRVYADKAFDKVNDKWIVPMLRNVRGMDMMVAFVSQSYIESYACFLELLTAVNSKKQVVFVSLGEQLHLGDTTDLPIVEVGAKKEILNQGSNIATNTNNASSDIMRAMKSAYTSISTLLEQDALSKYDISDAFINFFRDAAVKQQTMGDLAAVMGAIDSVSHNVFDESPEARTVLTEEARTGNSPGHPAGPSGGKPASADPQPGTLPDAMPVKPGLKYKALLIAGLAGLAALVLLIVLFNGPLKSLPDSDAGDDVRLVYEVTYNASNGAGGTGTYTGDWSNDRPNGKGSIIWNTGVSYEGEWKNGRYNGQGTCTRGGIVYEGEWENGLLTYGTAKYGDGSTYIGEWKNGYWHGRGTYTYADGTVITGTWEQGELKEKSNGTE